jgi:hypothetical protein
MRSPKREGRVAVAGVFGCCRLRAFNPLVSTFNCIIPAEGLFPITALGFSIRVHPRQKNQNRLNRRKQS